MMPGPFRFFLGREPCGMYRYGLMAFGDPAVGSRSSDSSVMGSGSSIPSADGALRWTAVATRIRLESDMLSNRVAGQ